VKAVVLASTAASRFRSSASAQQLRAVSAECKVVKNRLARLAIKSSALEGLGTHLTGPTAVVLSKQDPVAVAKALHAFARAHQALAIKAGYVEGQMLPPPGLKALADLPSREALRAQLVGAIQGLATWRADLGRIASSRTSCSSAARRPPNREDGREDRTDRHDITRGAGE
jgi:large subunit ribosomal protein L10